MRFGPCTTTSVLFVRHQPAERRWQANLAREDDLSGGRIWKPRCLAAVLGLAAAKCEAQDSIPKMGPRALKGILARMAT